MSAAAPDFSVDPQVKASDANIVDTKLTICIDNRKLTAAALPASYTGTWNTTNGAGVDNTGNVTGIQKGTQTQTTYKLESPLKLCPSQQDTVTTVRSSDITDPNPSVDKDTVCVSGSGVNLNGNTRSASNNETSAWTVSPLAGVTLTNAANAAAATASFTQSGTYTFTYTISNPTCGPVAKTVTVQVDAVPSASVPGGPETICGATYQLKGTAATVGKGKWTAVPTTITFDDPTLPNATAGNLPTGTPGTPVTMTFTWTVSNGVCAPSANSVTITRSGDLTDPAPTVDKDSVCIGTTVNLNGKTRSTANNETSAWTVSPTAGVTLTTTADVAAATAGFTQAGSYTFTYEIDNPTCNPSDRTVTVQVIAPPTAAILDPATCPKNINAASYQFVGSTVNAGYTGTWSKTTAGQQGSIDPNTGLLTALTAFETNPATGVGTTGIQWQVEDVGGKCPPATATCTVVRRDITIPDAGPDQILCASSLPITLSGNGPSTIPGIETYQWSSVPVGTASGNTVAIPANTVAGTYTFTFEVTNTVANVTNKDDVTIRIDAVTATPTLVSTPIDYNPYSSTANPYFICSDPFAMPGVPTTQPLGKNWWQITTGTGTLPAGDSTATPNMSSITGQVSTTYWYKNGVCPAVSVPFVLEKVGSITPATAQLTGGKTDPATKQYNTFHLETAPSQTADTLCNGGSYTLTAGAIKANETGTWSIVPGGSGNITLGSPANSTTQSINVAGAGTTQLQWQVKNAALTTCNPNTLIMTLVVRDVPANGAILGNDFLCEGTDTVYVVNASAFTSSMPITYTWDGGAPGASRTGSSVGSSTNYLFTSSLSGVPLTGIVGVVPSNRCGAGTAVSKTVTMRLAPRPSDFVNTLGNGNDTINGPSEFCAANTLEKYKLDKFISNTDNNGYVWGWNLPGGVTSNPEDDTSAYFSNWNHTPNEGADVPATVTVSIRNRCTDSALTTSYYTKMPSLSKPVTIIAPKNVSVKLSANDMFCETVGKVPFLATAQTNYTGLMADYTFYVDGLSNIVKDVDTLSPVPYVSDGPTGTYALHNGDIVSVRIDPDPNQCVTVVKATDQITMKGYAIDNNLSASGVEICESNGPVTLSVPKSAGNIGYTWVYNDTGTIATNHTNTLSLSSPSQSGRYRVEIYNSVCPMLPTKDTTVKIYTKPDFNFSGYDTDGNPFLITYVDGITVPMPVVLLKPINPSPDTAYAHYSPDTWLSDPDSLNTLIVPIREERDLTYSLTVSSTRKLSCETTRDIRAVNLLPLKIPNAFSPNGDGVNDTWVFAGIHKYGDIRVKVFNRWGSLVFRDDAGYKTPWDGNHNGQPLPTGTYYCIVELASSPDHTDQNVTSPLTIVR